MPSRKLIIVTGAHRSGSTWVGQMLSLSKQIRYIHEPFNIEEPRIHPLNYWFEYISENQSKEYQKAVFKYIDELLDYNYQGITKEFRMIRGPRDVIRFFKDVYERTHKRPLIKDPLAIMSADWIAKKFKAKVIITIRHPAAFVASVKVKKWEHPFEHFAQQKELMKVLSPYEASINEMNSSQADLVEQGILLWNIIYYRVLQFRSKHPDWIYLRHEDLSINPVEEFRKIYQKLHLRFENDIREKIIEATSASEEDILKRDSKKNITSWKKRLTKKEIERIKTGTSDIWQKFYDESDW